MATLVGVALAAMIFEIVRGPGLPPLPDAVTKPEQPPSKSAAPNVNRVRMLFANGWPEIPEALRKPLMILPQSPKTNDVFWRARRSIAESRAVPALTRLGGPSHQFYWPRDQIRSRGSNCPEARNGLFQFSRKDWPRMAEGTKVNMG
jgi:hypothetical protein